jgi:hypothetical protein
MAFKSFPGRFPAPKKGEGSKADIREDKSQAKKRGMIMKAWEKSPADKKADAAGYKRGGKVKRGK